MLTVGTEAPDFEAPTQTGERVRLSSFRGKQHVVLFFYPRDFTAVCTREACLFRDANAELARKDVALLGISTDSEQSHAKFASKHGLGYPLLADEDKSIARRYGAFGGLRSLLNMAKRITYVIDKDGIVRGAFHSELDAGAHLDAVKKVVHELAGR